MVVDSGAEISTLPQRFGASTALNAGGCSRLRSSAVLPHRGSSGSGRILGSKCTFNTLSLGRLVK